MRWHCRLSHVAAHTKMLTIFTKHLFDNPMFELEKVLTFVGANGYDRPKIVKQLPEFIKELAESLKQYPDQNRLRNLSTEQLSQIIGSIGAELDQSKHLTKWPCLNFRSLQPKEPSAPSLPIPYNVLSANCSDPFVTCSVHYDKAGG